MLRHLQRDRPAVLHKILKRLRAPVSPDDARKLRRRDPKPAPKPAPSPKGQDALLVENPDLGQLHRESPEAALDLLRLIREATRKQ